jgi:hypothetical protein
MSNIYEDFINKHYDTLNAEDARLLDLPDEAKDEAVYIWYKNHQTWLDDLFPACMSRGVCKIALEMLFGKTPTASRIVTNLFVAMAEDHGIPDGCTYDDARDDLWWSHTLDMHLDTVVNLGNFADEMREQIYLRMESTMEEEIFDQLANLNREIDWDNNYDG